MLEEVKAFQKKWNAPVGVEAVQGFQAVPQMLRVQDPTLSVFDLTPIGDKYTRAQPASVAWAGGRILIPRAEKPWIRPYVGEMRSFTGLGDAHDDQVDMTTHGWNVLYREAPAGQEGAVEGGW